MGRLIAFVLAAAAIVFFGSYMLPESGLRTNVLDVWEKVIPGDLLFNLKLYGGGLVAGVGLLLFAVRGSRE
jgi:hypothetical protein